MPLYNLSVVIPSYCEKNLTAVIEAALAVDPLEVIVEADST
jgi:hypothetical protein